MENNIQPKIHYLVSVTLRDVGRGILELIVDPPLPNYLQKRVISKVQEEFAGATINGPMLQQLEDYIIKFLLDQDCSASRSQTGGRGVKF